MKNRKHIIHQFLRKKQYDQKEKKLFVNKTKNNENN